MTPTLNTARLGLGATTGPCPGTITPAAAKQCIYVIGGYACSGGTCTYLSSVEYYDPSATTPSWTTMTSALNTGRDSLAATTGPCPGAGGQVSPRRCLYAIGGFGNSTAALSSVEYYDPSATTPAWIAMNTELNTPRYGLGATTEACPETSGLTADQQCLYAVGGYNHQGTGDLNTVEYYDPNVPSVARVVHVSMKRRGASVQLTWRVATNRGFAAFDVYAGRRRLNRHAIPVHPSRSYHYSVRYGGRASLSLRVLLSNGERITVPLP